MSDVRYVMRWPISIAGAVLATALLAAACGSGSDGGSGGGGPTPTPAPSSSPGAATPTPGPGPTGTPGPRPTPTPRTTATPEATPTPAPSPTPEATPTPTPGEVPPLVLTEIAAGLDRPLYLTAAPGDRDRLYVVEQTGRIRVLERGVVREEPFLDLSASVSCCGERGLLGLAFHPDYAASGRFFVDYTNRDGDTEVVEYARASSDAGRAHPDPVRLLLRVDQPFSNHNGGMLAFAPDGTLIIGLGDGGGAGDPFDNARNLAVKLGKLLRVDVDRYPEPPPGNVSLPGADPDVWHYGLRNPWRFSFDRATGDLLIGDVGQNLYEEIDLAPAGASGLDFGWRGTEGLHCFNPASGCDTTGVTLPVAEYDHDLGCSVTGGYVYRGRAIPGLVGHYLYGDYCSNRLWSFVLAGGRATRPGELTPALDPGGRLRGLTSFGEDQDGEIHLVGQSGSVFRIDPAQPARPAPAGSVSVDFPGAAP